MQVKLSGAGKWPYFTSAYKILYFKTLQTLLGVIVNKLKDRRNFSLAELIWKGTVGNFSIRKKKRE